MASEGLTSTKGSNNQLYPNRAIRERPLDIKSAHDPDTPVIHVKEAWSVGPKHLIASHNEHFASQT